MRKRENVKKDHHYVFQRYMQEWTDPRENAVWVLREKKKLFSTGTAGVGFAKNFYSIKAINDQESKLLDLYMSTMQPAVKQQMENFRDAYLVAVKNKEIIDILEKYIYHLENAKKNIPDSEIVEIKKQLEALKDINKKQINNPMEDYYCEIEGELSTFFETVRKDGIGFYYTLDKNHRYEFLLDICIQYFRTQALKERWVANFGRELRNLEGIQKYGLDMDRIDLNNLAVFIMWHLQIATATALLEKNAMVTLIRNNTHVSFITGDQPIINLKYDYSSGDTSPTDLELYYPISPYLALLINEKTTKKEVAIDEKQVKELNQAIFRASKDFIIGNSKELLALYQQT